MGFAAISDQLACDDCLDFKEEFKNACDIQINYHIACCFHGLSSPLPLCVTVSEVLTHLGSAAKV